MSALQTVDLDAIEILAVGGPVHGTGSAPGGDHWTREQLLEVADANRALAGELKPSATIGHATSQDPAVGWLENVRINEAGDRLLADVKRMPKRFSDLIKAGAYRTRSVQLSRVTSQRDGRRYENVITGLAWLGGKLPAVRTLDDVVALYADDEGVELQRVYTVNQTPAGETVIDRAIFRGALRAEGREASLRAYAAAPDAMTALIEGRPSDSATAYRNQALLALGGPAPAAELEKRDLAERERIARDFGGELELEDVPELSYGFSNDPDVAERQQIAREYGMRLEDVL